MKTPDSKKNSTKEENDAETEQELINGLPI